MKDEIVILEKQMDDLVMILNALPEDVFRLKDGDTLLIVQRRMEASDLQEALALYNEIFTKVNGADLKDICQSASAYVKIKTLVEGKEVNFDARLLRQLIKEYANQMTKVKNIIHLSKINAMTASEYQKEMIQKTLKKNEAFLAVFADEIKALEKKIERTPEPKEVETEQKETNPKRKQKEREVSTQRNMFGKVEKLFTARKDKKEIEEKLKVEEEKRSQTKCVEIPFYDRSIAFTEHWVCKDIPSYSLLKRKNNIYFGLTGNIKKDGYDNSDQSLLELTEATEDFVQYMTIDLLSGEYVLKPFTVAEKQSMQMYFNFIANCFEKHIGKTLTVQEYLAFKSYYNKVVLVMFDLEEKFRTDYYRALVIADSYTSYMGCYDLSFSDDTKTIVNNIMNGKIRNYVDDLELIVNNHMVDLNAMDRVQELMEKMKHFNDKEEDTVKEDESEEKAELTECKEEMVKAEQVDFAPQLIGMPVYGMYGGMPMLSGMGQQMNPGVIQIVIQVLNQDHEIVDEALYAGNNIKQALYDYETKNAQIKRLGFRSNGTDVFYKEEAK